MSRKACGVKETPDLADPDRIVWATGWQAQEESVLRRLAGTRGLACAWLEPYSDLIQLVTYDGDHLGHVRLDGLRNLREHWIAVSRAAADPQPAGDYATAQDAAKALARAAGKMARET
jgi:hypothetical protein